MKEGLVISRKKPKVTQGQMRHIHRNVSKELLFQASSSLDIELLFSRVYLAVQVWCFISRLNDSSRVLECVDNFTGSGALGLSA